MATAGQGAAAMRLVDRKPIYERVSDRLREFIDVNELQPGDKLMTERELAAQLSADYERYGITQGHIAPWEDGFRSTRDRPPGARICLCWALTSGFCAGTGSAA